METGSINLPPPKELSSSNQKISHFFVGDEAFPLRTNLMRPYSRKGIKSDKERIFNYRLSRARRIIENAFGILSSRWRVFHSCICMKEKNIEKVVLATICLHNFLMMREEREAERRTNCPITYIDYENQHNGLVTPGMWREINSTDSFHDIGRLGCNSAARKAVAQRNALADWMISEEGQVPWQSRLSLCNSYVDFFPLMQS